VGVAFDGDSDQLASGTHAGAGEELLEHCFDRSLGDAELLTDLLVAEAFEDAAQYAPFSCAEGFLAGSCATLSRVCEQDLYHAWVDPDFALHDAADGLGKLGERAALEEDAGGSVVEGAQHDGVAHAAGDHEDLSGESVPSALGEELRSGFFAEVVVEQDEIDDFVGDDAERLADESAGGGDAAFGVGFEQPAQALAKEGMVVDDEDTDRLAHIGCLKTILKIGAHPYRQE
jgi:hypothetical protein